MSSISSTSKDKNNSSILGINQSSNHETWDSDYDSGAPTSNEENMAVKELIRYIPDK